MKLQKDGNEQYKLTLPKSLIEAKGWKKGDKIKILLDAKGNIVLENEAKKW